MGQKKRDLRVFSRSFFIYGNYNKNKFCTILYNLNFKESFIETLLDFMYFLSLFVSFLEFPGFIFQKLKKCLQKTFYKSSLIVFVIIASKEKFQQKTQSFIFWHPYSFCLAGFHELKWCHASMKKSKNYLKFCTRFFVVFAKC